MNYLDIVLEAKRKKKEAEDKESNEKEPLDEDEPTDYTEGDTPEPDEEEVETDGDNNDEPPEEVEPTDYTADAPEADTEIDSEEEETPGGDNPTDDPPDEDQSTDYTEDAPDAEGDDGDGSDNLDGSGDTGEDDTSDAESAPTNGVNTPRNRRLLLEDFTDLYFNCKSFLNKINSLDKTDTIINQSILQIDKNINRIKDSVWDYIVNDFDANDYSVNLYKYNLLIEAFKANIQILSKVKDYIISYYDKEERSSKKSKKSNS